MTKPSSDDARAAFVELIRVGAGGTSEPDEPTGPRAPRPDLSQGAGMATHPEDPKQAFARLVLNVPPAYGDGGWTQVIP